jgi:hypothetical protein
MKSAATAASVYGRRYPAEPSMIRKDVAVTAMAVERVVLELLRGEKLGFVIR